MYTMKKGWLADVSQREDLMYKLRYTSELMNDAITAVGRTDEYRSSCIITAYSVSTFQYVYGDNTCLNFIYTRIDKTCTHAEAMQRL